MTQHSAPASTPALLVLDVNETLSDLAPLAARFEEVGLPGHLAPAWFAGVLRDGFALGMTESAAPFALIGQELLRATLTDAQPTRDIDDAIGHVMSGFMSLDVHPDVAEGLPRIADAGIRLVTLSNGASAVAEQLLERAGLARYVEALLTVEDAHLWKPARSAYEYAVRQYGVVPKDAMLVAAHPWDVHGAQRAGLRGAWVNRSGGPHPGHFLAPDVQVATFTELADLLAR